MRTPTATFLVHGTDTPPAPPKRLQAGPLTLDYDRGDLRCVMLGEREVIRRIGGAVRDRNWAPGTVSDERIEADGSAFRITCTCTHRQGEIHFVWRASLGGDADGTLRFEFDGEARSTFLRNRIGLCVLHPMRECAGARARAYSAGGAGRDLAFPEFIAAEQPVSGFDSLSGLAHEVAPGIWAEVRFSGELFETEDQRNWTDASFKTYGTPLHLPFPVEVTAGTRIRQGVEVRLAGAGVPVTSRVIGRDSSAPTPPADVTLQLADEGRRLPEIGLGTTAKGPPFDDTELARLTTLNLGHLRADVKLTDPDWRPRFRSVARSATELGLPLEVAVHLPAGGGSRELPELRREMTRLRADVSRVLGFQDGQRSSTAAVLAAMREHLGDLEVPIGAGTNADLYQLNLQRPPSDADFICWSMNPQVHADDSRSLMETPEAAVAQVASVKGYFPGLPLVVSPITLRPRFNPNATVEETAASPDALPAQVDPRQMTLVGAAWTVAMLAVLAPGGVESLSFFEATGWRGVMETAQGSPLPCRFPSFRGGVFPVWHVFAGLAGFRSVAAATASDPRRVAAFAVADSSGRRRLIGANLTPASVEVNCKAFRGAVRVLDGANAADAMREPEAWWRQPAPPLRGVLPLPAYGVAFMDLT